MLEDNKRMSSLLTRKLHCRALCWKVTRVDGAILRFTSHNTQLILSDGQTYTPNGFITTATRSELGLKETNKNFSGGASSGAITEADLSLGLYRSATIIEYEVDWRFPWAGVFLTRNLIITTITFDGEEWSFEVAGLARKLHTPVGKVYTKHCWNEYGDALCTHSGFTDDMTVNDITSTATGPGSPGYGKPFNSHTFFEVECASQGVAARLSYKDYGHLVWLTGNNTGSTMEIKYGQWKTLAIGEMMFHGATIKPMQVGDTFRAYDGCGKSWSDCDTKSNLDNFNGFENLPGADEAHGVNF
jgi:hypothetical protein